MLGQATSGDPRGLPLIHYCLFEHPAFVSFVWLILVVLKPGPHDLLFNELKIFSGSMLWHTNGIDGSAFSFPGAHQRTICNLNATLT